MKTYYPGEHYGDIENWLHVLSVIRNRCAHYSRIFNYKIPIILKYKRRDSHLDLDKSLLFGAIYNLKYLVKDRSIWRSWVTGLSAIVNDYTEVDTTLIGFPDNWEDLLMK